MRFSLPVFAFSLASFSSSFSVSSMLAQGRTVASWWHLFIHSGLEQVLFPVADLENCSTQLVSKSCMVLLFLHTVNHQTFTFASPFLSFLLFNVTKKPESHMPHDYRLSHISSEGLRSDKLMLHIHLVISISVRWILHITCNIALLTQAL